MIERYLPPLLQRHIYYTQLFTKRQEIGGNITETKNKKKGRPKSSNPKSVEYGVRFDIETELRLRRYCEFHNISKGEAIRRAVRMLLKME